MRRTLLAALAGWLIGTGLAVDANVTGVVLGLYGLAGGVVGGALMQLADGRNRSGRAP